MCIALLNWDPLSVVPLVILHNRDEFYARPALPMAWQKDGYTLRGTDLQGGGGWLGVNRLGRFALVVNDRRPGCGPKEVRSRGELVPWLLDRKLEFADASRFLSERRQDYRPFYVLFGDTKQIYFYASHTDSFAKLKPGLHGLSNGGLNTPWPKIERAKWLFYELARGEKALSTEQAWQLLQDEKKPPEEKLPQTGLPTDWEWALSSIFIQTPKYGTRCSSFLLWEKSGAKLFCAEQTYYEEGEQHELREFDLAMDK